MLGLLGVISTSLFGAFGYWGVRYTTATNASIIGASGPFIQVILSWLVLRLTVTAGKCWNDGVLCRRSGYRVDGRLEHSGESRFQSGRPDAPLLRVALQIYTCS